MDRPEAFRYGLSYGTVLAVHPESWEVDIRAESGGVVQRVIVQGPRLPEISTPERPQWVIFGYTAHHHGQPVCFPVQSRLPGPRTSRAGWVYYEEVLNFRITINRQNEIEIRNALGDRLLQLRIQEDGGVIRLDTPTTRVVLDDDEQKVEVHADGDIEVDAGGDINATATGDIAAQAGGSASVTATADITLMAGGNISISATGAVTITGATIALN